MFDTISPEFIMSMILTGTATYAAIRVDLKIALRDSARALLDADSAHNRISHHIETHHTTRGNSRE
jgi:hypothetical protein